MSHVLQRNRSSNSCLMIFAFVFNCLRILKKISTKHIFHVLKNFGEKTKESSKNAKYQVLGPVSETLLLHMPV